MTRRINHPPRRGRGGCVFVTILASLLSACTGVPRSSPAPSPVTSPPSPTPSTTSPAAPLTFAVMGDWGAGTTAQRQIAARMCASIPFAFVLTTGDNFYAPDGVATDRTFYEPERCLLNARVVWRPAWGNHDAGATSTASVLGARERFYDFAWAGVDFFVLDSNRPDDAAQHAWLEQKLSASTARVKIVVFHHPPFTASLHDPNTAVRRAWVSLFERFHVTLVLNGHNHVYERHLVHGVQYVVSGGGGASLYSCLRRVAAPDRCSAEHHFLIVRIAGENLSVEAVTADGALLDRFSLTA